MSYGSFFFASRMPDKVIAYHNSELYPMLSTKQQKILERWSVFKRREDTEPSFS